MLLRHPGQITSDATISCVIVNRSSCTCRRCLDHWLQGLGLSAGAQAQQAWLSGLLPGLQELSAGTQLPRCGASLSPLHLCAKLFARHFLALQSV